MKPEQEKMFLGFISHHDIECAHAHDNYYTYCTGTMCSLCSISRLCSKNFTDDIKPYITLEFLEHCKLTHPEYFI